MFELYFIFYRIPKMMSRLARERNRSAVKWSLLGIAGWIGAELIVAFGLGIVYEAGTMFLRWPRQTPVGLNVISYVACLAAAIGGFTLVRRILYTKSPDNLDARDNFFPPPPPPPRF